MIDFPSVAERGTIVARAAEAARQQFERELFEAALADELARLRTAAKRRTPWQQFLDALPFTITMKKRTPSCP